MYHAVDGVKHEPTRYISIESLVNCVAGAWRDHRYGQDGLRIIVENFRKSMNISRQIPLSEVSDSTILVEAQRELGIRK